MTSSTHAVVITSISPTTVDDPETHAISSAKSLFDGRGTDLKEFYFDDPDIGHEFLEETDVDEPVTLDSADGQALVQAALDRTVTARMEKLKKIDQVYSEDDVSTLASDEELRREFRRLGTVEEPTLNFLYDATSWSRGNAIIGQNHLDELKTHHEDVEIDLYAVPVTVWY